MTLKLETWSLPFCSVCKLLTNLHVRNQWCCFIHPQKTMLNAGHLFGIRWRNPHFGQIWIDLFIPNTILFTDWLGQFSEHILKLLFGPKFFLYNKISITCFNVKVGCNRNSIFVRGFQIPCITWSNISIFSANSQFNACCCMHWTKFCTVACTPMGHKTKLYCRCHSEMIYQTAQRVMFEKINLLLSIWRVHISYSPNLISM